jgi:hypothetical protein
VSYQLQSSQRSRVNSSEQALVGDRLRDAYRSGASKQQRGALVGPLWEEARTALVGQPHPGSSDGVDAAAGNSITALNVDSALKAGQLSCVAMHC